MSGNLWTEEQFNCPVCLDLPNEPVTIPCGHSYCMCCIKDYWSKDDPRSPGVYSCPQCRQTFCPKPSLSRNTMLAEAVEQLRKGALTTSARESIRSAHRANTMGRAKGGSRGGGVSQLPAMSVPCDTCHGAGDQRAAVKSCLVCMASYCEAHLKPHQTKAELKKHELIAPTGKLAQKICTEHKYLQEFYCRRCQMFVCWLCTSNQHKDHETTSTKAERTERQKELAEVQTENHQRLKEREGELKDMKKMLEATKRSADRVHDDTATVLSELQRSVERLQELVEGVMNQAGQEKVSEAQDVVDKLEAEISELKRRDKDMKEVFRCEDNIHFLETCESLCSPFECNDLSCVVANPEATFEPVREAILNLRERVEDMCNVELGKITKTVNDTTLFTLGDKAKQNGGQKTGGFRSLFSGLGSKTTTTNNIRPAAPTPTVSVAVRGPNSRGVGLRSQDVRSREEPRADRDKPRREERKPGGMGALTESQPEVNTSLFLDPLTPDPIMNQMPAFPALREIDISSIQAPEPRSREEFLQYACTLTLDTRTAHRRLSLSEGNTKATLQGAGQPYPDCPQRFDGWTQVLCQAPLSAQRCYWEVDWRGKGSTMGVAYGALSRKGADARAGLGYNAQSWSLELSDTCCTAMHDNEKREIPVTYSPRLGLFLDLNAGTLAFYSVAESMAHLHTFRANFTQPLYAAFGVGSGVGVGLDFALGQFSQTSDSIKICPA
uniref:Tripartite motif containing 25, like n=1 Tax=Salmo trutta TaxID=8032 RepID=A0A674BML4_SALTR